MVRLRSVLLVVTASIVLALAGAFVLAAPSGAQSPTTTVVPLPDQEQPQKPSIIPLPNSGHAPEVEGDPGSGAQYAVLFGTMGGMVAIALLVRRESKKKAANKTHVPDDIEHQPVPRREASGQAGSEKVSS